MPKSKEFVSTSESDSGDEPETKKVKIETKITVETKKKPEEKKKEPEEKKKEIKAKKEDKAGPSKGKGGETMFQLSKMRYATVSEFRGKVMVGIREYYDADDGLRPGKKGISLSSEQWNALKDHIDDIDKTVEEMS